MTQTTQTTNAVASAMAKIKNIQSSIVNGDKSLTSKDLAQAKAELEFCELQEEARRIIAAESAESERKATLLNLQKRLSTVSDSRKVVNAKLEAFTKSLNEYLTSCTTFQSNLNSIRSELREAGLYPETDIITAGTPPGKVSFGVSVQDARRTLSIGEIAVTNAAPEDAVKPIIESALGEYNRNF
jgi:chromosome segregation ATPase